MAGSAVVGILRALLMADTAQFDAGMKRASDGAYALTRTFKDIGKQATDLGRTLSTTRTRPLVAAAAGLVKVGKDFDDASDSIRSATGATGKDLDKLNDSFKKVFGTVPASVKDTAAVIGDLSTRTGATGERLEGLATQMLNLSRVGKAEVGPLVAATTRAFGDWSIATDKQGASLDYLYKVSQSTGIGVTRLTELVVQFGAPLRSLGFSFEDGAALMGKWEKEGVNLETVLSGLRFALGKFAAAGKEPQQALKDIQAAILGAKTEADATAIAFQTFGKRAAVDMSRAILEGRFNIDELVKSLKNSKETINTAAYDTLSLSEKYEILQHKVMLAVEPLGRTLVQALERATGAAEPVIHAIDVLSKGFTGLPDSVQTGVVAFAALVAAAGPVLWVFGQAVTSAATVTRAFTETGLAMRALASSSGVLTAAAGFLLNPITLTVAALALLGVGIYAVATAETDLEASLRENADGFKANTAQLKSSLDTYRDLVNKQQLTKDESDKLADATRDLAKASGLSEQAFNKEQQGSSQLTDALREQLKARQDLITVAIDNARGKWQAAAEQLAFAKEQLTATLQGTAKTVNIVNIGDVDASSAAASLRTMTAPERVAEVERLNKVIADLATQTDAAKVAYQHMAGVMAKDVELKAASATATTGAATAHASLASEVAAAEKKIRDEIAATGYTIPQLVAQLKAHETGFHTWAESVHLSQEALKFLDDQLKTSSNAQKAHEEAIKKTSEALEKVGIITLPIITAKLKEYQDAQKLATESGVPLDKVVSALYPKLHALAMEAKNAGIESVALATEFQKAKAIFEGSMPSLKVTEGIADSLFNVKTAVKLTTPEVVILGNAMTTLGIKSQAELDKTAREAETAYRAIAAATGSMSQQSIDAFRKMTQAQIAAAKDGATAQRLQLQLTAFDAEQKYKDIAGAAGAHAPEAIAAYKAMVNAQLALTGQIPSYWQTVLMPAIQNVISNLGQSISGAFAGMISDATSFKDGFISIWQSIKSAITNIFSQILNAFIGNFIRGLIGALTGQQGAFASAFAGLMSGANGGSGGGGSGGVANQVAASVVKKYFASGATAAGSVAAGSAGSGAAAGGGSGAGASSAAAGAVGGAAVGFSVGYGVGGKTGSYGKGIGAGAASGAATGAILGGPIGAGVGALAGAIGGYIGALKNKKKTNDIRDEFSAQFNGPNAREYGGYGGGMGELGAQLSKIGKADLFENFRKAGNTADIVKSIDAITEALGKEAEAMAVLDKYGVTAFDSKDLATRQKATDDAAKSLISDLDILQKKGGIDLPAALAKTSGGFSQLVVDAVAAGTTLPASLQSYLEALAKTGQLSAEAVAALSGVSADTGPDWKTLQADAEKYGVALSALGPAFQQGKTTETANELVEAFNRMNQTGADTTGVLEGMKDEVQEVVTNALKFGTEVPESMRFMLNKMVDFGQLTDENGEKLTDLSQIKFSTPIETSLDKLAKVMEGIAKLLGVTLPGAAGEGARKITSHLDGIPDKHIDVYYDYHDPQDGSDSPAPPPESDGHAPDGSTPGFAGGTHGRFVDFGAGTLVRLHGREAVVTEAETRAPLTLPTLPSYGSSGFSASTTPLAVVHPHGTAVGGTAILQLDSKTIARAIVPHLPGEVQYYGITRGSRRR